MGMNKYTLEGTAHLAAMFMVEADVLKHFARTLPAAKAEPLERLATAFNSAVDEYRQGNLKDSTVEALGAGVKALKDPAYETALVEMRGVQDRFYTNMAPQIKSDLGTFAQKLF